MIWFVTDAVATPGYGEPSRPSYNAASRCSTLTASCFTRPRLFEGDLAHRVRDRRRRFGFKGAFCSKKPIGCRALLLPGLQPAQLSQWTTGQHYGRSKVTYSGKRLRGVGKGGRFHTFVKPSEPSVISTCHRADVVTVLLDLISVRIRAGHLLVEHHRRDVHFCT